MRHAWTADEADRALKAYERGSWAAVFTLFPNVKRATVVSRTQRIPGFVPKRRPWMCGEIDELIRLWNAGNSAPVIAARLGRTENAVELKITELRSAGREVKRRVFHRWTPGQERFIDENVDQLLNRLAMQLGATRRQISKRIIRAAMLYERREKARLTEVA